MPREIVTRQPSGSIGNRSRSGGADRPEPRPEKTLDRYADRLFKYIPAEIIAVYVSTLGIIKTSSSEHEVAQLIIFLLLMTITPIYLYRISDVRNKTQLLISTMSFVVWVISLGGPSDSIHLPSLYSALLLTIFTLIIAVVKPDSK